MIDLAAMLKIYFLYNHHESWSECFPWSFIGQVLQVLWYSVERYRAIMALLLLVEIWRDTLDKKNTLYHILFFSANYHLLQDKNDLVLGWIP